MISFTWLSQEQDASDASLKITSLDVYCTECASEENTNNKTTGTLCRKNTVSKFKRPHISQAILHDHPQENFTVVTNALIYSHMCPNVPGNCVYSSHKAIPLSC